MATIDDRKIAYFSMEAGLESGMPTYSGGLEVLAGDTIRSAADMKLPFMAVSNDGPTARKMPGRSTISWSRQ